MQIFQFFLMENWDLLQYPFVRDSTPAGHIRDIQDGKIYRRLAQPGEFLSIPEHAGLILNADGAPIFKAAGHSLWPIYLSVTSFPPQMRMKVRNLLLAGVWCASVKPDMKVVLGPVLAKINQLKAHGIQVKTTAGHKTVKACLLMAVFELLALAMACNTTQFNGNYGCLYCLAKVTMSLAHMSTHPVMNTNREHQPNRGIGQKRQKGVVWQCAGSEEPQSSQNCYSKSMSH